MRNILEDLLMQSIQNSSANRVQVAAPPMNQTFAQQAPVQSDPRGISRQIQEWLGAASPMEGGKIEEILAKRPRPGLGDWADSVAQTATTGKPVSPEIFSDARMENAMELLSELQKSQFQQQQFAETQRHNLATEALTGERNQYLNRGAVNKPLPVQALKLIDESTDVIGTANTINADLNNVLKTIDAGKLDLGPVQNIGSELRNFSGLSSENSRNYGSFMSSLEKLRNDSLRLNKGVQTEGDSIRAWNELVKNINDENLVKQRLEEIVKINERGANLQKVAADRIMMNYGRDPLDYSAYENQPGAVMTQSPRQRLEELRRKKAGM